MKKKPSNLILLTHKCGNMYFNKILKKEKSFIQFQSEDIRNGEMPGPSINKLKRFLALFITPDVETLTPSQQ